jgi:geranylgeranylglyceryl phosphate synthase family protein
MMQLNPSRQSAVSSRSTKPDVLTTLRQHKSAGRKALAVLLDPDEVGQDFFSALFGQTLHQPVDFFFVGGSLITDYTLPDLIAELRPRTDAPVVLFPGNALHIEPAADAILLLSLISGRNPEFLIGQHVLAAPLLKRSGLDILPTGYLLVDGGAQTTVSYVSNTTPLPADKPAVAACTALAGELLGLQLIYMDAGSGARRPVSPRLIAAVREVVDLPIIVGGGIDTVEKAAAALSAGADLIVVGNAIERDPAFLAEVSAVVAGFNAMA